MKLGDTIFNGNAFKNIILNSKSYKRMILGTNLVWSYFGIAIKAFRTRILADSGTYEAESILEDKLQEITPDLFDSASLVITPNGVKTSKLYSIKPNDGTGDLTVVRNTSATRIDENGNIVDVPANVARIDYSNGSPAILVEPQRTNLVYPSDIATTQVRAVTAVAHTLSFYGTGTITLSGAFSGSLAGTGTKNRVSLTFTPTAGNLTLTVSGSVTNWQLEPGRNTTSLIKTASGSVTRNVDVISKTGISSLIGQTEGTIYAEINLSKLANNFFRIVLGVSSGSWQNGFFIFIDNPGAVSQAFAFYVRSNNSNLFSAIWTTSLSSSNFGFNKLLVVYKNNEYKFFVNGVLIGTRTGIYSGVQLNTIHLDIPNGITGSSSVLDDSIKSAFIFPTALTNQQAIQLTTL